MGALLSIPLLAVPSMGTVRHPTLSELPPTDFARLLHSQLAVVVQRLALQYVAHVVNVAIGQ